MFVKPLSTPYDTNQLISLNRRVIPTHYMFNKINKDYNLAMAGLYGEKEVYFYLKHLPSGHYFILHNIRLRDSTGYFQMDYIIITVKFILILEVKNYTGKVYFNQFDQLELIKNSEKEVYQNPINQVERHQLLLQNWLLDHLFLDIPVYSYVVFSSPTTLIQSDSSDSQIHKKIISGSNLVPTILQLEKEEKNHYLTISDIRSLSSLLIESHSPYKIDIQKKYRIQYQDLIKGIHCPYCSAIPLEKNNRIWLCRNCDYVGPNNYIQSLNDYYYLISDQITNKEARDFLQIHSSSTMRYLLHKAGYKNTGDNKGRKYFLQVK